MFVPVGLITVMLGPLLPILSARWSLTDTQSGYLVTAQFVGSLLGTVCSGFVLSKIAFRWTMIVGVALMAFGAVLLPADGYWCGMAAVFGYGMGIGLTVPTANLMVAQASGEKRSSVLNLLNFFWGAGAVACPVLLASLQPVERVGLLLAVLFGLLVLALVLVPIRESESVREFESSPKLRLSYLASAHVLAFGALFFLYVGSETALGAWLATFAKRASSAQGEAWLAAPAYFYGALLIGRIVGSWILRHISDLAEARASALLAVGGVIALVYTKTQGSIAITAALIGLGLSTLYPIAIGFATTALGNAASRVMGTLFALSTLGGASLPWMVGYISTRFGGLRTALLVPVGGCFVIAALYWNPALGKYRSISSANQLRSSP